jgi:hypothetical protein
MEFESLLNSISELENQNVSFDMVPVLIMLAH